MRKSTANRQGILPVQDIRKAVENKVIYSGKYDIPDSSFQPASLDLRLGETAYRLRCSFLPESQNVESKLREYSMEKIDLRNGAILERNRPYLIPLMEQLSLPEHLEAKTNPKSSTGRLDVFTRVITDCSPSFDHIRAGYESKLYLEVVSRTFTIKVKTGLSLNQIRLINGDMSCSDKEIVDYHKKSPILYVGLNPVATASLIVRKGLFLSVDLTPQNGNPIGYKAKKNSSLLDLTQKGKYSPDDFWEPIRPDQSYSRKVLRVVLEPEEFYLLWSKEKVVVPPQYAAEMTAYDPTNGELRTHYAGFFDPGFGYDPEGKVKGSRSVMEVRAHDVPFMIEDGQKVAKLEFQRMLSCPDNLYGERIGSSYQFQEKMLSKHFYPAHSKNTGRKRISLADSRRLL